MVNLSKECLIDDSFHEQGPVPLLPAKLGNKWGQPLYVNCLIDSGANINLIRRDLIDELKSKIKVHIIPIDSNFQTSDAALCKLSEQVRLYLELTSTSGKQILIGATFFIVDVLPHQILLGTPVLNLKPVKSFNLESIYFQDGNDTLEVKYVKSSTDLLAATSTYLPAFSFKNILTAIPENFNNNEIYSFKPKSGLYEAYFTPHKGFNLVTIYNDQPYGVKINKGDHIGTITKLPLNYDPDDTDDNLFYFEENFEVNNVVAHIHFKDKVQNSKVLNQDEKLTLIKEMDENDISQLSMTDYIEEYDRSQCEFPPLVEQPKVDPVSRVDLSHLDKTIQQPIREILRKNRACLAIDSSHIGKVPEHILSASIPLKDPEKRFRIQKFYPLPPAIKQNLQEIIDNYLKIGILEYSDEPAQMISNLLAVKKKDGSLRLLCDLRLLNSISQKLTAPFIQIPHIADLLQGNHFRSSMDMTASFFQISVDKASRPLLCFRDTQNRLIRYKRLPQGLTVSPYYLSELSSRISEGLKNTLSFVDDFIMAEKTLEAHNILLDKILSKLCELNLTIRPEKLQILREEIDFLGFTFRPTKYCIPKIRIKTFLDLKPPRTAKTCKSMICAWNFFRNFIPDFTHATHHMRQSYRNPKSFQWTPDCEREFHDFKKILEAKIELQYVDFTKDFVCYADASKYSVAFSIFQTDSEDDTKESPLTFCARTLHKYESSKSANELETCAIIWGLVACDVYLRFATTKILVKTDCRSLLWLKEAKEVIDHAFRLSEKLNQYHIHIQHISGTLNSLADFYSRLNMHYHSKRESDKIQHLSKEASDYMIERLTIREGYIFTPEELKRIFTMAPTKLFTSGKSPPKGKKSKKIPTVPLNSMPSKKLNLPKSYSMKRKGNNVNASISQPDFHNFLTEYNFNSSWLHEDHQNDKMFNAHHSKTRITPVFRLVEEDNLNSIVKRALQVFQHVKSFYAAFSVNAAQTISQTDTLTEKERKKELQVEIFRPDISKLEYSTISSFKRNGAITKQNILETQVLDQYCQNMFLKLKTPDRSTRLFSLDNLGILGIKNSLYGRKCWRPVLPKILLTTLVSFLHYGHLGMHLSPSKISSLINRSFYYPNIEKEVKLILADCFACFYNKAIPRQKMKLAENVKAEAPLSIIACDYAGEFPRDSEDCTKLIILVDEFSGYVVAYPCKQKDDDTSERYIKMFVHHFGQFDTLRSDNEKSLKSKRLNNLYNKYQIRHMEVSPYNPNANSRVETVVRKLKEAIRANLHAYPNESWSSLVTDICLALNSSPLKCGATASELMFGSNKIKLYEEDNMLPSSHFDKDFSNKLESFRNRHTGLRSKHNDTNRILANENLIDRTFDVNDVVYVEVNSKGPNDALRIRREGPYYITELRHQNSAQLQSLFQPEKTTRIAHFKDLIPAKESLQSFQQDEQKTALVSISNFIPLLVESTPGNICDVVNSHLGDTTRQTTGQTDT